MSTNKERKSKKISFEIYKDQSNKLDDLILSVLKYSNNDKNVPHLIVNEILGILTEVYQDKDVYTQELINQIFKRFRRYDFESKKKVKVKYFEEDKETEVDRVVKMNLELLIETIITLTKDKKYNTKEDCIRDIYTVTENIISDSVEEKYHKQLNPYFKSALSGFIAIKYNFYLFSGIKPNPTNYEIFQASRNALKIKKDAHAR